MANKNNWPHQVVFVVENSKLKVHFVALLN
jgi:hypothetical protein